MTDELSELIRLRRMLTAHEIANANHTLMLSTQAPIVAAALALVAAPQPVSAGIEFVVCLRALRIACGGTS